MIWFDFKISRLYTICNGPGSYANANAISTWTERSEGNPGINFLCSSMFLFQFMLLILLDLLASILLLHGIVGIWSGSFNLWLCVRKVCGRLVPTLYDLEHLKGGDIWSTHVTWLYYLWDASLQPCVIISSCAGQCGAVIEILVESYVASLSAYMTVYAGPPPPSGTVHFMYSFGILMEQHLQWTQFWAFITKLRFPTASASVYSYTPAGQNRCSGPA